MKTNCRKCNQPFEARQNNGKLTPFYPFCSQKCRLIDLGKWLDSQYQIHTKITEIADQQQDNQTESD